MPRRATRWLPAMTLRGAGAQLLLCSSIACSGAEGGNEREDASVSFSREVFPVIERSGCADAECHSDPRAATTHFSDYRTAAGTYEDWRTGVGFDHCGPGGVAIDVPPAEPRVVAGDPDASLLVRKLEQPFEACPPFNGRMPPPPRPRMSAEDIALIRTWIAEGARYD